MFSSFFLFYNFISLSRVTNGSLALFFFDFAIFESLFQGKYLGQSLSYAGAALHGTAMISKGL